MDLIDRINANYNNLSRVHKRIVDYITDNPDRACFQSLKDFSDSVSASPVTVLRCLDKLGINGFLDLKKELRAYTRQSVYPGKRLASALSGLNSTSDIVHRVVQADLDNITNTFENLSSRDMYRACDILRNCGRVHLVAQGVSKTLLPFLQNRLSSLNIDVQIFDVDSTIFLTNMLSGIRTNDAFFMLSFPRLDNSRMPFLAEQLVKHNIPIVCMAENPASAVARHATVTLICQADTPIYYNSYSAPMVMANALVSLMAGQMKDDVQAFQTQIENLRSEYTAYSKMHGGNESSTQADANEEAPKLMEERPKRKRGRPRKVAPAPACSAANADDEGAAN